MNKILPIILVVVLLIMFYPLNAKSHSGRTNLEGCHVNTYTGMYHCHKRKSAPLYSANYCIVSNAGTFCGYSSYSSCFNAAKNANITNFQCMQK